MKRYSEMSAQELQTEIGNLQRAVEKASSGGEREVLRQKWLMARSYAARNEPFPPGTYEVEDREERFALSYMNGVMGWGTWENGEEGAVPLAALKRKKLLKWIRITNEEELRKAFRIRIEVFVKEQGVPEEVEMDEYDASPESAQHMLLEVDGQSAAAGRFIEYEPDTAKFQRIAVKKTFRGQGTGKELMLGLEAWAKELGYTYGLLDAQCQAESFYAKLGYATVSPETFLDAGIPHVRMKKTL